MIHPPWLIEIHRLARIGDADSQYYIGKLLLEGSPDVKKDLYYAVMWLHKAAIQEHAEAQFLLAKCFAEGHGGLPGEKLREDHTESVNWYRKAAKQGHNLALLHLGECYAEGKGVQVDKVEAFAYLKLAGKKTAKARDRLKTLRMIMTPSEIKAGQTRLKDLSDERDDEQE